MPRQLPSATDGVPFEATFTLTWRPTRRGRPNLEDFVRERTVTDAAHVLLRLPATDVQTAQDTVNALLGEPQRFRTAHYRLMRVHVALRLTAASHQILAQRREDQERVRRLRFLRDELYEHPSLLLLDRIERSTDPLDPQQVADWQRVARSVAASEKWWHPLLEQWELVGRGFTSAEMQNRALLVLHDALAALVQEETEPAEAVQRTGQTHLRSTG
ncbi:hypothetical protein [Streptomyces globisporus]|uniref:hypothetical protein n=1 Tax=Streptomyces globisporus TaxID=1908 RepID=UPI00131C482F|nr:hypothetical protein [Streptomyces globisporus]